MKMLQWKRYDMCQQHGESNHKHQSKKNEANISYTQPGGIEHRSTVDHLLIAKETIKNTKETEETNIHCIPRCDTGIW